MAALIRACLVAGYGNIAIDGITVTSEVATATITNNVLEVGTVIEITGATPAELNAEWKITAADNGSITFATPGIADVTATGTIGASIPAAGWEEPYPESGNYACFRALSGVRQFYRIDDNQADADVTLLTMFDSMSDAQTGIGGDGSVYFGKKPNTSGQSDWVFVADEKTCYVCLESIYGLVPHGFGDFFSYIAEDPGKSFVSGHMSSAAMTTDLGAAMQSSTSYPLRILRTFDGIPGSGYMHPGMSDGAALGALNGSTYFPALAPGVAYAVMPGYIREGGDDYRHRGILRGTYYPLAYKPKNHRETFDYNNKLFIAINCGGDDSSDAFQGQIWFDVAGPWEESS
jgi:hypothetical protein